MVKRDTFGKFSIVRKLYCIIKDCPIKYCWFLEEETTANNSIFEINLYFFLNKNVWERGLIVSGGELKFWRRDLQILVGDFAINIMEYWKSLGVIQ